MQRGTQCSRWAVVMEGGSERLRVHIEQMTPAQAQHSDFGLGLTATLEEPRQR